MRTKRKRRLGNAAALFLCLTASLCSCSRLLRYPVVGSPPGESTDRILTRTMDPSILSNRAGSRLIIEVDWVQGCAPSPMALAALGRVAREYCAKAKEITLLRDDEIPRRTWESCPPDESTPLVNAWLDKVPDREAGTEVLYMLYLPRKSPEDLMTFGRRGGWTIERDGRPFAVKGMVLYKEAIRERAKLWATADRLDRGTLVHEFGHLLGLVGNPAHMQSRLPGHCANPECVMAQPQWRSILYFATAGFLGARMPQDYCRDCREDIRRAQRLWEEEAAAGLRLQNGPGAPQALYNPAPEQNPILRRTSRGPAVESRTAVLHRPGRHGGEPGARRVSR